MSRCPRCGGQMWTNYGELSCLCGYRPGDPLIPGQSIRPAPGRDDSLSAAETVRLKGLLSHISREIEEEREAKVTITTTKPTTNMPENMPTRTQELPPVPPQPAKHGPGGGNIAIGHYYTAHLAEIKAEASQHGEEATRERWGLTMAVWKRLKGRWSDKAKAKPTPQSVVKGKPELVHDSEQKSTPVHTDAQKSPDGYHLSDELKADIVYCVIKAWHPDSVAKKVVEILKALE